MRIMITGGGTGGHTSPALAILEELHRRDPRLMTQWVGKRGGLEARICQSRSLPFRAIPAAPWPRRKGPRMLWTAAVLAAGVTRGYLYIKRFRPDAVISVGGYISLPLVLAAQRAGLPTFLHEQNKRLGMANQLAAKRAARLFLSYEGTVGQYPEDRAQVVGNPVRGAFFNPPGQSAARRLFDLAPEAPSVLVCGGSQGARTLNHAVREALPRLDRNECQLIWITGPDFAAEARTAAAEAPVRTAVFPFIDNMDAAYAAADIAVCRAGASTAAELAAVGRPAILVPFPYATENHQEVNARAFEEAGAGRVVLDSEFTADVFVQQIRDLLPAVEQRETMARRARTLAQPGAAEAIAESILSLLFEKAGGPQA